MSFLRHAEIYRSDDASAAGRERLCSLPALIGLDEFQPAIPWQVALQQSLPPLRRLPTILNNLTRRTMTFQRTVTTPLIRCLSPRVQSTLTPTRAAELTKISPPLPPATEFFQRPSRKPESRSTPSIQCFWQCYGPPRYKAIKATRADSKAMAGSPLECEVQTQRCALD
jgi:hypothetical protein